MPMKDLEAKVLENVKEKYLRTGGNNGNTFGDFDHILKMHAEERNIFLERIVAEKKIVIKVGANRRMTMLPK